MRLLSSFFILFLALLFNCSTPEEISPVAASSENDKTLLAVIETTEGHRVSFHEYFPGLMGVAASYPLTGNDPFTVEIKDLLDKDLSYADLYKQLAKDKVIERYVKNIEAAAARWDEIRSKQPLNKPSEEVTKDEFIGNERVSATSPWCPAPVFPFPSPYNYWNCQDGVDVSYMHFVSKNFRTQMYLKSGSAAFFAVTYSLCPFENCPQTSIVNQSRTTDYPVDYALSTATPGYYWFGALGVNNSQVHMGVGIDKATF